MNKKRIFQKISFLVSLALITQLTVFHLTPTKSKAADDPTPVYISSDITGDYTCGQGLTAVSNSSMSSERIINGSLTIPIGSTLIVPNGQHIAVTGPIRVYGTLINLGQVTGNNGFFSGYCIQDGYGGEGTTENYGTINVLGSFRIGTNYGGTVVTKFTNYASAQVYVSSPPGNSGPQADLCVGPLIVQTGPEVPDFENYGEIIASDGSPYLIKNIDNGRLIIADTYCNTDNMNLNVTTSGTVSSIDGAYLNSFTVTPPTGWKISESVNGVKLDELVFTESKADAKYFLFETATGYHTMETTLPAFTVRSNAIMPSTPYTITCTDGKGGERDYYQGNVTITPASGYKIAILKNGSYVAGNATSGVNSYTFTSTARNLTAYLFDNDDMKTAEITLPDINIIGDFYHISASTKKQQGDAVIYIRKTDIIANDGYRICLASDSTKTEQTVITVSNTILNVSLYVKDVGNGDTEWIGPVPIAQSIVIKSEADMPDPAYTLTCTDGRSGQQPYYEGDVTLTPASGYKVAVLDRNNNYLAGDSTSGAINYTFTQTSRGAKIYLYDSDGLRTASSIELPEINIFRDAYEISGLVKEDEDGLYYISKAEITAGTGYKIRLSTDSEETQKDLITFTETTRNVSLYVKDVAHNDNQWLGPIELPDFVIKTKAIMPEKQYTLTGTTYRDKYFQSDVVLKPAEGYKVTTSKDKEAVESLKFTKTERNVKIYLKDEDGLYTDEITVGDIVILRPGDGKVSVDAQYFGGKLDVSISSSTHDTKLAKTVYVYPDGSTSLAAPTAVGKYTVRVTFPENDIYQEVVTKADFEIKYLPTPTNPYTIEGTVGDNEFYTTDVTITPADGYSISDTLASNYVSSLTFNANSKIGYIYLRKLSTGEMTDRIEIKEIMIDKESPFITDLTDNQVIYTDAKQIIVQDDNLDEVFVNGEKVQVIKNSAVIDLTADEGIVEYTIVMKDKAGNVSTIVVTLISEWMKEGNVKEDVPLKLYPGMIYHFPEGSTWTVEGDPTVYHGGNSFIVEDNVEITFNRK